MDLKQIKAGIPPIISKGSHVLRECVESLFFRYVKGVLINSEKVCDLTHSWCSYLLFPTAGEISTCWGILIASYPDIINENFVSHGAEIWPSNRHFGHVDPVQGLPPLNPGGFSTLNANFSPTPVFPATRMSTGSSWPCCSPLLLSAGIRPSYQKIAHLQVANKPHTHHSLLRFIVTIL